MLFAVSEMPKSVRIQEYLTSIHIDDWIKQDLFNFRWCLLLSLIIVALLIWWKLLDKARLPEIFLYVVLITIIVLGIVEYGDELVLWDYPTDIIPIFPPLTSINLVILPLIYSLTYQYFKTRKSFIWATLIITSIICFIIEPIFVWLSLYELVHWKYYFSRILSISLTLAYSKFFVIN
ncbi:MAG TPA: CBO0543 family protein [Clostridiaceae bacterium]